MDLGQGSPRWHRLPRASEQARRRRALKQLWQASRCQGHQPVNAGAPPIAAAVGAGAPRRARSPVPLRRINVNGGQGDAGTPRYRARASV